MNVQAMPPSATAAVPPATGSARTDSAFAALLDALGGGLPAPETGLPGGSGAADGSALSPLPVPRPAADSLMPDGAPASLAGAVAAHGEGATPQEPEGVGQEPGTAEQEQGATDRGGVATGPSSAPASAEGARGGAATGTFPPAEEGARGDGPVPPPTGPATGADPGAGGGTGVAGIARQDVAPQNPAQKDTVSPGTASQRTASTAQQASRDPGAAEEGSVPASTAPASTAPASTAPVFATPGPVVAPVIAIPSPATTGPAPAPAPPANAAPDLGAQISGPLHSLARLGTGEHRITLHVTPENLGPVAVRAVIGADGVRVELLAPNDAAREALRLILPELRRDLAGAGLGGSVDLADGDRASPDRAGAERDDSERPEAARRAVADEPGPSRESRIAVGTAETAGGLPAEPASPDRSIPRLDVLA